MAYEISGKVGDQLILLALNDTVNINDFTGLTSDLLSARAELPMSNILLLDVSQLGMLPIGQQATSQVQRYTDRWNFDYVLVVGANKLMRLMLMLIFTMVNMHFFETLDEAYKFAATLPRAYR